MQRGNNSVHLNMGKCCVVAGNSNSHKDGVTSFRFHTDQRLKRQWTRQIERTKAKWQCNCNGLDSSFRLCCYIPVNLHMSNQACVTPTNTQISLMLFSNIQVDFVDLWQPKNYYRIFQFQLDKSRYLNPVNVSEENVFLVFDTAHGNKRIQTFSLNRANIYQLQIHSVSIPSETEKSIKSWSDLETYSCTLTCLYSLVVHYCRSVVVIRNKLSEGPKHLNTLMRILDEENNAIDLFKLFFP